MARKVFISILGTSPYAKCKYVTDNFVSSETKFAQQATLEYISAKEWTRNDKAYLLLTEKAKKENWDITERLKGEVMVKYSGLKYVLQTLELPFTPEEISIPDGQNETEMWKIFTSIFEKIEIEDELYIDLTHSFRYLPMLLLVLSNYAKFLKNVKVKKITYGNYEARNKDTNEAPIIDLLPISALQDWTFAAADYLENGNAEKMEKLSVNTLTPILKATKGADKSAKEMKKLVNRLKDVTEEFQTCRGLNIVRATNIKPVKTILKEIEKTVIEPFNPILEKINQTFESFDADKNIKNGFQAAKWCYDNGLYQQSATILQENIVSFFCNRYNIEIDDEDNRELINSAFVIKAIKIENEEAKWKTPDRNNDEIHQQDIQIIRNLLLDEYFLTSGIVGAFSSLSELRNDINHSGMRKKNKPLSTERLKYRLKELIELFLSTLTQDTTHIN